MSAFRILFPHIPKTGGTTLLYHFRQNLGEDKIFTFGPHARSKRFFSGLPQFEEMSAEDRAGFRVIQGHGVDDTTLSFLPVEQTRLMVVCATRWP